MIPLNVLMVEDNPDDAELIVFELESNGFEVTWERVDTKTAYLERLSPDLDIVISDYNLPTFDGIQAFKLLQQQLFDIPFILVSGTIGDERAVECIKLGMNDYILKERLTRLPSAIEQALEHKYLQQALMSSEERLRATMRALPDVVFLINEIGQYIEVLTTESELLSLESHAYAGRYIGDVLPPEQVQVIQDTIDTCITTNEKQVIEYELQFPSGSRWLESRIAPTDLTVKGYRTVVLIARDITHHKNLQHELRSLINATSYLFTGHDLQEVGEQIVKAVVNELGQADCGLLLVDADQEMMIRVARAGEYEVKADQPLYVDGGGVVTHAIREEKSIYISNTSTDERYVANQAKTRSELVVPLWSEGAVIGALDLQSPELHAFSSQQRRLVEIFATRASSAINIRQLINEINQNNAELELRVAQRTTLLQRTTEQIQGILNSSKDVIILSNAEGLIEQVNPAFEEQFAYRATSIFNEALDILIVEDDRDDFRQCREQVVTDKQMQRLDVQARTLNETAFFADIVLSPIMNDEEQVDGIICSIRDISQRKQLETDLRQALKKEKELNDLKSRFVSMVSHEYRTPLATIQLAAEGLQRYRNRMSEADMDKRLRRICEQTQYMTQLMEDMLSISKTQAKGLAYKPTSMSLRTFVNEIVESYRQHHHDYTIEIHSDKICHEVNADAMLLRTIISNLLSNAIKYCPIKKKIEVQLTCTPEYFSIAITDHGIGIPEDDKKHLFDIFHRATNVGTIQGTGLGLVIVKQCVDAHSGLLTFESQQNGGTTFTVRFQME